MPDYLELGLPTVYDTAYLALAQMEKCDFWTADRRFFNAAHSRFDSVHWLGDHPLPEGTEENSDEGQVLPE